MSQLKKVVKFRTVVSTSAGMAMATSCYAAGIEVANMVAGQSAWIAVLVAGIMCMFSAMCFAELNGMYPSAAGIRLFIERAFGEKVALAVGAFYVGCALAMVGPETYILSNVIHVLFPSIHHLLWVVVFLGIIALINYRGVIITGIVQDILSYSMIIFMLVVGIYAISISGITAGELFHTGGGVNVFEAAAVGVFLYVGFEWVTPLAEEVTESSMIARGMLVAVGLLCITYAVFITGMTSVIPKEILAESPIPHIEVGRKLFGEVGLIIFIIMSVLASMTSYNAGFLNFSRYMYAMGRDNVLPRVFSSISRYATPWFAILFCFAISLAISVYIYFSGRYIRLIMVSAAIEVIIYLVMALAVIRIRKKLPDNARSYRVPGGLIIPIIAVVFFIVLLVGIYAQDIIVLYIMIGVLCVCLLYTLLVVPRLRAAHVARMAARKPRRRRTPTNTTGK